MSAVVESAAKPASSGVDNASKAKSALHKIEELSKEIAKNEKEEQKLLGLIKGKEAKLSNASFVDRAPANVVETETK